MPTKKKKISSLPLAASLKGLHTIGVDNQNKSVKVSLEFVETAADNAEDAAIKAMSAAKEADDVIEDIQIQFDAKVDKVPGKGLSTHDFDDAAKTSLTALDEKSYTTQVDTPVWTTQPAIEGALNAAFVAWPEDFYFVTLRAADGQALPAGQFRLTPSLTADNAADPAKAIDQTFTLPNLNTGNSGVLKESAPVDFTAVGDDWKLRSGGVTSVQIDIEEQYKQGYDMSVYTYAKVHITTFAYSYYHPFLYTSDYLNYHSLTGVGMGYKPSTEGLLFPPYHPPKALKHLFNIETCHLRLIPNCWQVEYARSILGYDGTLSARTNVWNADVEATRINGYCFSTNPAKPIENLGFRNLVYSSGNGDNPILNGSSLKITLKKRN